MLPVIADPADGAASTNGFYAYEVACGCGYGLPAFTKLRFFLKVLDDDLGVEDEMMRGEQYGKAEPDLCRRMPAGGNHAVKESPVTAAVI